MIKIIFRKLRWFWIPLLIILLVYVPFQIPCGSNIERPILQRLKLSADEVPRTADGLIDFATMYNKANYVPPEENLIAQVISLLGSESDLDADYLQQMGIQQDNSTFESLDGFLLRQQAGGDSEEYLDLTERACEPWDETTSPLLNEWLITHENTIDQLREATQLSKSFIPIDRYLLSHGIHVTREAARSFNYKLNHSIGSGKIDLAIAEYIAIYRLSRAVRAGPSYVDDLIGIALHAFGVQSMENLLSSELLTSEHLAKLIGGIAEAEADFAEVGFREQEKLYSLGILQQFERSGVDSFHSQYMEDGFARAVFLLPSLINWEIIAIEFLQHFEDAEKISAIDNDAQRLQELKQYESAIADDLRQLGSKPVQRTFQTLAGARARGYLAAKILTDLVFSSSYHIEVARVRAKVRQDVTHIGIAIELFRLQRDRYPEKLEELVPEFLEELPHDRFTNGPLSYVKTETHYFVCSAGPDKENQINLLLETPKDDSNSIDDSHTLLQVRLKPGS